MLLHIIAKDGHRLQTSIRRRIYPVCICVLFDGPLCVEEGVGRGSHATGKAEWASQAPVGFFWPPGRVDHPFVHCYHCYTFPPVVAFA